MPNDFKKVTKRVTAERTAREITKKGPFKFKKGYINPDECQGFQLTGRDACASCRQADACPYPVLRRTGITEYGLSVPVTQYMGTNINRKKLVDKK